MHLFAAFLLFFLNHFNLLWLKIAKLWCTLAYADFRKGVARKFENNEDQKSQDFAQVEHVFLLKFRRKPKNKGLHQTLARVFVQI